MVRNHRYNVSFAYFIQDGHFGNLEPKLMNYDDLDYFLKMLDPLKSLGWLEYIRSLHRHSDFYITLQGNDGSDNFKKIIKITRN